MVKGRAEEGVGMGGGAGQNVFDSATCGGAGHSDGCAAALRIPPNVGN